jgi:hypothetical protein
LTVNAASHIVFQSFDGSTPPVNGDGSTYPDEYGGSVGTEGGTASVSINTTNSISGNSLDLHLTAGQLYAEFNPYNYANNSAYPSRRGFARNYAQNASQWQLNTYDRMSFWVLLPTTDTAFSTNGDPNFEFGTYVKQVTNADSTSDEAGGNHYYHLINLPALGTWTQVILNMHPDHRRGDSGSVDPGLMTYPTTSTYGGADPASTYNYFDTLTRFYLQEPYTAPSAYPADYLIDNISFYKSAYQENDTQVYSLTGTYRASDNRLLVTWNRDKAEDTVKQEVRYSFSDIHVGGWASATAAPNGTITPPGSGAYNNMVYNTTGISMGGHSMIYIAIKPQNSTLFTEIAIPIDQWMQTSASDFSAGTQSGTAVTNTSGGEVQLAAGSQAAAFVSSGTFISSVYDAGRSVSWGTANWDATVPAGTTLTVLVRSGTTATPDGTWSSWTTVSNGGSLSSIHGRYLQYELQLTTTNPLATPILSDIWFTWS